ncbi:putative HTH-type transcriptional regulator YxaF [Halomicronema hongdechloris C2206]|uniref:HTH-type transcriptional regulator YxaF n=1 Tax=Halomicronema hongdechloris C2206 TaxID=1641165 RepID=A0A1Z3HKT5_9CYAN|nr:TetR/AcrR family transcriptional regulator [Halomicronema hongdechloris]ASC70908.1 putative HTH-type transcriptional regulator YxaF [Halomicronema hongdechloris C2206]
MAKADLTRARIIQRAANLFNLQGYAGSSMADIMQATGLKKGGIYNHFASKDDLALAAFDFAVQQVSQRYREALQDTPGAIAGLKVIVGTFCTAPDQVPLQGGCPLLNTAIESDDTHSGLREKAQGAMGEWRRLIRRLVQQGLKAGELRPAVDPDTVATIVISTLEGALMMTKLYGDRVHLERGQAHLEHYIDDLRASP